MHEVDLYLTNEAWVGANPVSGKANVKIWTYNQMEIESFNDADRLFNNPPKSLSLKETQ